MNSTTRHDLNAIRHETSGRTHSPGPWTVHIGSQTDNVWIESDSSMIIAPAYAFGFRAPSDPVAMANARLIALSPDLLTLCQGIVAIQDQADKNGGRIDAAELEHLAIDARVALAKLGNDWL